MMPELSPAPRPTVPSAPSVAATGPPTERRSGAAGPGVVISVSGLRMRYGERDVLRGVDLTVEAGEVFAMLGPNGAGKTTTIEVLEGFRRRSAGTVRVLGVDPQHADGHWRARIGVVQQSWRDHGRWRVGELLTHLASFYPDPRDVDEVLGLLGLAEHAGQVCHHLSGGQRRRLDVALGIVGNPELLFLDEPTAGFDPVARHGFHDLVERLRDGGMTLVITTHDLDEAARLADRIAIVVDGRIAASGTAGQLADAARAHGQVIWSEDSVICRRTTPRPSELVWELHARLGGPIPDLEVRRPTLEDIYLRMIRQGAPT